MGEHPFRHNWDFDLAFSNMAFAPIIYPIDCALNIELTPILLTYKPPSFVRLFFNIEGKKRQPADNVNIMGYRRKDCGRKE